jgi:uncharacterized protein (DUF433 family)
MAQTVLHIDEIVSDPKIRGGRPVIKGTGIRVIDLIAYHLGPDQSTAEELAEDFRLEVGQVYAAFAYYFLHKAELEADMRADAERAETLARELEAEGKLSHIEINLDSPENIHE